MVKVLFVCLGNICRSPMAEGVFRSLAAERVKEGKIITDSAGTSAFHIGENPDKRMCETALKYSVKLNHKARQFCKKDLEEFDYILPMDKKNLEDILVLAGNNEFYRSKIRLMLEFDPQSRDLNVPDPYYGGMKGFEDVYHMLERSCSNLLDHIIKEHNL